MLYWIKLCIIFIGILPCFTLRSCQYLMFYSLITPFWAQQYYASKLHSRQNKKFLKCTKEPYASSRTWKINNKLIYVCSWAPLIDMLQGSTGQVTSWRPEESWSRWRGVKEKQEILSTWPTSWGCTGWRTAATQRSWSPCIATHHHSWCAR